MGVVWEDTLNRLYDHVSRAYGAHEPHEIVTGRDVAASRHCPNCGAELDGETRQAKTCGGGEPTEMCNELMYALFDIVDKGIHAQVDVAQLLLADTPQAWEWGHEDAPLSQEHGVWGAVVDAFRHEAYRRLGLEGAASIIPTDPRTTKLEAPDG